jgi:hypothetical protein
VKDGVGIQIVKLNPISKEEPMEEWMQRKRKSSEKEGEEEYLEPRRWSGNDLWPGDVDLRLVVFQDADLGGILQVLFQELGLYPIAQSGRVGIGGLGLGFLRAGGGGTSLAHGGGTQGGALAKGEQRCAVVAKREEEDDDGGGVG